MLLGQLYYYDKELDRLQPGRENLGQVELLGVPSTAQPPLTTDQVVDLFIQSIWQIFREENYRFDRAFWEYLKSVQAGSELPPARSEFQETVLEWVGTDYAYANFEEVLRAGELTVDEEDFALYYALRALHKLVGFEHLVSEKTELSEETQPEIAEATPILVVTEPRFFPLYKNLGIEYMHLIWPLETLLKRVHEEVRDRRYQMVLVDTQDEEVLAALSKKLKGEALVSGFSMEPEVEGGFFQKIVRDTLGVRLT